MALQVFAALATQWNVGQAATIGLRYEAMPVVLQMVGIPKKQQAVVMQDVREMESEALRLFNRGRA